MGTDEGSRGFTITLGVIALLLAAYHVAMLIHHLAVIRLGAAPVAS